MWIAKKVLLPLGLIAIAVLAGRVAFEKDDTDYSSRTFDALIKAVGSDFEDNEDRADSAPQQQVVAGWATKDYLSVIALQAEETNVRLSEHREASQRNSERSTKLIALGIGAICWIGIWMPFGARKPKDTPTGAPVPSLPPPPPSPDDESSH